MTFSDNVKHKVELMPNLNPNVSDLKSISHEINSIKDIDTPDMFGLNKNVEKNVLKIKTIQLVNKLRNIKNLDNNIDRVELSKSLCKFWKDKFDNLPKQSKIENVSIDPLQNWVVIELQKVYNLIKLINETLSALNKHSTGGLVPQHLSVSINEIYSGNTPEVWKNI